MAEETQKDAEPDVPTSAEEETSATETEETPVEAPEPETGDEATTQEADAAAEPEPEVAREVRIVELEAEAADLKDKLLRVMAESENVRRRASRDREETAKYAIANFAREILSVADNLQRALGHIDADARAANEAIDSLASGVEMTERELLGILERFGVKPIEAMGQKFDHNFHEAMFELEDAEKPAGTVVHEMRKGYVLQDRLLRPSQVGVSKGGPTVDQAAPEPEAEGEAPAAETTKPDSQTAYEKQADAQSDAGTAKGTKLDQEL